ncbi:hypothetical protein JCM10207_005120 [Rhodosporidiobolus poonsookiae]
MLLLGKDLYRSLLREARALPLPHLTEHYTQHIKHTFRQRPAPEASIQAVRRVNRANKLLRHLQAANDGYLHALQRAAETAYGLRGRGKWAALAPFTAPAERSASFPPALAALVTSPHAHLSRQQTAAQLLRPPSLPERAEPTSEEARLLGPLIPQRIKAIKRRYWTAQVGKLRAPLALQVRLGGERVASAEEAARWLCAAGLALPSEEGKAERAVQSGWDRLESLRRAAEVDPARVPRPPRRVQAAAAAAQAEVAAAAAPARDLRLPREKTDAERRQFKPRAHDTKWHAPKRVTARLLRRVAEGVAKEAVVVTLVLPAGSTLPPLRSSSHSEPATPSDPVGTSAAPSAPRTPDSPPTAVSLSKRQKRPRPAPLPNAKWEVSLPSFARGERGRYRELSDEERVFFAEVLGEEGVEKGGAGGNKGRKR